MSPTALTLTESKRLIELERRIEAGKETFLDVGKALVEIRDSKLYEKAGYKTFEVYCREKWGWEKRYFQYVIKASETVRTLPPESRTIVRSESQARELSKVPAAARPAVLEAAGPEPTAAKIRAAAERLSPPEPTPSEPSDGAVQGDTGGETHVTAGPEATDAAWKAAIGKTDAKNFFAAQIEDIGTSAIEEASVEQLKATKLACEVWARRLAKEIKQRKEAANG